MRNILKVKFPLEIIIFGEPVVSLKSSKKEDVKIAAEQLDRAYAENKISRIFYGFCMQTLCQRWNYSPTREQLGRMSLGLEEFAESLRDS